MTAVFSFPMPFTAESRDNTDDRSDYKQSTSIGSRDGNKLKRVRIEIIYPVGDFRRFVANYQFRPPQPIEQVTGRFPNLRMEKPSLAGR
jgi:hypothetical protein